jgi:CRP-like cAMP-binding protein
MVDITRLRNVGEVWEVTWKFEDASFETLRTIAEEKHFKAGTQVFRQGDKPDGMYLVLEGSALIVRKDMQGREHTVGIVSTDQSFGEIGLVADRPRAATVVAGTDLTVLKISRYAVELLKEQAPDLGLMMYQALARTLAEQLIYVQTHQNRVAGDDNTLEE